MIAFLINDLSIRGGTHKQFLKLLEYTDSQGVDFIVITKILDYNKTYPGVKKFESKITVLPFCGTNNPLMKLKNHSMYASKLKEMLKGIDKVNIHDSGFELYLEAFEGKDVYWQINDLPYSFIQMHNSESLGVLTQIKNSIFRNKVLKGIPYVKEFSVNVSKNRERIQQNFNRDAKVFYCGIDPIKIERDNANTLKRFAEKKINLLSSGVFFPYRNYETQVDVVKELVKEGYDVKLNIMGSTELSPEYSDKIRVMITQAGLQDRITICGQVNDSRFQELHQESDIFLFINVNQSWGLAVFEAMSCGFPVIVSKSVGAIEILSNGENALFVDPFDAKGITKEIIKLIDSPDLYETISNKSKKIVDDYTWDKAYSSKMLNLILKD